MLVSELISRGQVPASEINEHFPFFHELLRRRATLHGRGAQELRLARIKIVECAFFSLGKGRDRASLGSA